METSHSLPEGMAKAPTQAMLPHTFNSSLFSSGTYRVIHKSLWNFELGCSTTTTDTAERSISIGRESLQVFFSLSLC